VTAHEPTPVHDEARSDHDRHAAALTPQDLRQWEDLAAELARPHPARLRRLLEAEADPAAAAPNRVAAWALERLFPADGDLDPERLRADAATLGCELVSVGEVLRGWLLVGAVSQGLVPEGAVAQAVAEKRERTVERRRLRALAVDLRAIADDGALSVPLANQLLRYLPQDVLEAAFCGDDAPSEPAPLTDMVSPALNEPPDERAMAAEILERMQAQSTPAEVATEPEEKPWPAELAADSEDPSEAPTVVEAGGGAWVAVPDNPSEAPTVVEGAGESWPEMLVDPDATEVIEPTDETQELR
jgi:hypothetical protein